VFGRLLGVVELVITAAAGGALLAAAVAYVRAMPVRVEADRVLRPPRRHAGAAGDVEITVRNTASRTSPTLGVHDPFESPPESSRRWARFRVAPLRPGQAMTATYELPGEERGVYELGPLKVHLEDPFGLAARAVAEVPVAALVVYPRMEILDPFSPGPGSHRHQARPVTNAAAVDGDLYALREYHMGDDLRRVHWRATAKRDEVMIRHDDVPVRSAATVVLDLRDDVHTPASLEAAISAAASIVHTARRHRWPGRLVTSDGADSGLAAGHAHTEAIFERLATAGTHRDKSPAPLTIPAGGRSRDTALAVVTTETAPDAQSPAAGFMGGGRGQSPGVLVIVGQPAAAGGEPVPPAGRLVHVGVDQPLAPAWAAAMGRVHRRRAGATQS
jgi:uncharacterized protein (DUF58 family)